MHVHPTGVEIVDYVVGGMAPGLPCVVAGSSGSGRTVLALQLAAAALQGGRVVAFLCNEPPAFLLQQAATLGFDLELPLRTGQLVLLELDPVIASTVRAQGMEALVAAVREEEPIASTIIVDPFTAITVETLDEASLRIAARGFVRAASPMEIVLTLESERLALQQGLELVLSEICGCYLTLSRDEASSRRSLVVSKTRFGVAQADRVDFAIGDGGARRVEEPDPAPLPSPAASEPQGSAEQQPARGASASAEARRPVVLLVDPDEPTRNQTRKWLEAHYDVVTAGDGFEAMTTLLNQRPDLLVLDLVMPRISGYELLSAFRRAAKRIPRLVLSERVHRSSERLGPLVLGATDLLAKPVERFELLHKIELLLRLEGPEPEFMEASEAEALFGNVSKRRALEREEFESRLERACRFGERFGIRSSLLAVTAPSTAALEQFLACVDENLRFEDAAFVLSPCRAVLLLVAADDREAQHVFHRLLGKLRDAGGSTRRFVLHTTAARPADEIGEWRRLFVSETADAGEPEA